MTALDGLLAGLARERHGYAQLTALLEREAALLRSGDMDGLAAVARDKEAAADTLAALAATREAAVAAANPRRLAMTAWFQTRPAAERDALAAAWAAVLEIAAQARRQNEDNGLMLRVQGQHIDARLDMLMRLAGQATGVYDRDGHAPAAPPGRLRGRG